jgi:PPOX class probable FMN-dependent enzyme
MPPHDPSPDQILSEPAQLESLYAPPSPVVQKAVTKELLDFHRAYLRAASFFCLATGSDRGLDATPRGGPPGFVRVLDNSTLVFADWPGNNRIESMRNLLADDRAAMVFLFPGLDVFLRINGRARISTDAALLADLAEGQRVPKCAVVVAVEEVLFHCGKAVNRAKLWDPASHIDKKTLPSVGTMMVALADLKDAAPEALDAHYDVAVKTELY